MKTSCLYCVNPDCGNAGSPGMAVQDCQLFLDPRKELERVRAESAVHKLASETLHSELVRVTARAERLEKALEKMLDQFGGMADGSVTDEARDAVDSAKAALAEQPAQESKPAEPRRYYYETVYGNRKTFTADSDEAAKKRVEGVSSLLVLYRESDTPDGTPFIRLIDRYSKPAEPAGGK